MNILSFAKTHKKTSVVIGIFLVLLSLIITFALANKISPISWGWWGPVNSAEGVAIQGFDPVAYHQNNQGKPGNPSFSYTWNGVNWYFSTADNQKLFQADPEIFVPQYGGYCATAVGENLTANINPEVWHLQDGKLYLFFDEGAKNDWVSKIDQGIIGRADQNWARR